ncbi:MAG TPA: protein kinase [Solirubrobacterales bacterium]|jgi:serine/threonine-protein kinase|nr:protein kinase [Solirubrobacterales bacterium]
MIGTVLSGRYRLDSKLGSGGMSTVYLAIDETLERPVAVKVLHAEISDQPDQIERFRREARSVAKLSHPNVVAVIDAGQDAGHPYIVFEYIDGETLKQRIERIGALPLDESAAYAIEVGRGLVAAHARNLVHRDVKPQNVLIDPEGRAKVTDFGIARSLEAKGLTATGRVLGTTDYVAPEQAMGQKIDARSDVYSLGVLLYEMLTGEVPFRAETQVGVAMKHVNEPLPNVQERRPEVSAALAAVVETATAKDPERRYPTMAEMLRDLESALEVEVSRAGRSTGEVTTVLDSVPPRRRRILTRRRVSWAGILLVLGAAAAAVAIVAFTGENDAPRSDDGAPTVTEPQTASDFDPFGTAGEHTDEVQFAVDGNPTTAWTTETYEAENLGKPGVGLFVDAGKPTAAQALEIRSDSRDWDLEVYGSDADPAPEAFEEWEGPIGSATIEDSRTEVPLEGGGRFRYFLMWITRPASTDDGFLVEINEVRILS